MTMQDRLFGCVPDRASEDMRLTRLHWRVINKVARYDQRSLEKGWGGGCFAGRDTLAAEVGCHPISLSKAITQLVNWGYVERTIHPTNKSRRVYRVIYQNEKQVAAMLPEQVADETGSQKTKTGSEAHSQAVGGTGKRRSKRSSIKDHPSPLASLAGEGSASPEKAEGYDPQDDRNWPDDDVIFGLVDPHQLARDASAGRSKIVVDVHKPPLPDRDARLDLLTFLLFMREDAWEGMDDGRLIKWLEQWHGYAQNVLDRIKAKDSFLTERHARLARRAKASIGKVLGYIAAHPVAA